MTALTIWESADLLGRYRYVELLAYRSIGTRVATAVDAAVARSLAGASLAHAWRARLIEECLPVSVGLPGTETATRSPSSLVDEAVALACEAGSDRDVVSALVDGLYPAMDAAYLARVAAASTAADPPVVRALTRARADLAEVSAQLSMTSDPGDGGRAAMVADLLARAGGVFGQLA